MSAVFSPCGLYRFRLDRSVDLLGSCVIGFCLHNSSVAGRDLDDPTSTRCLGFARAAGAARMIMVNPWAAISTDPRKLWTIDDPVGPNADWHIADAAAEIAASGGFMIAGWGVVSPPAKLRAAARARLAEVESLIRSAGCEIRALGINADGSPKHPLYLRADSVPLPWPDAFLALRRTAA